MTQIALFPEDRAAPVLDCDVVSIRLSGPRLRRPRQWGACRPALIQLDQLRRDDFWRPVVPPSREGTNWLNVLKTSAGDRLMSPGSAWRLHRHWFEQSATGDLLGEDIGLVHPNTLYRCLDTLIARKQTVFGFYASAGRTCLGRMRFLRQPAGQCAAWHPSSMKLTAIFEPAKEGGYTCFVEEVLAAISQGETRDEAKANLLDALNLVSECSG